MKRVFAIAVLAISTALMSGVVAANEQAPPEAVQKQLIALDKQWGEAGTDTAILNKILADHMLALGPNGEAQGKQEQVAAVVTAAGGAPAGSYLADEHKFDMLSPDIVVMTHRGTTTSASGKESHRSLHVFQRKNGNWQIVASAQVPIPQK